MRRAAVVDQLFGAGRGSCSVAGPAPSGPGNELVERQALTALIYSLGAVLPRRVGCAAARRDAAEAKAEFVAAVELVRRRWPRRSCRRSRVGRWPLPTRSTVTSASRYLVRCQGAAQGQSASRSCRRSSAGARPTGLCLQVHARHPAARGSGMITIRNKWVSPIMRHLRIAKVRPLFGPAVTGTKRRAAGASSAPPQDGPWRTKKSRRTRPPSPAPIAAHSAGAWTGQVRAGGRWGSLFGGP